MYFKRLMNATTANDQRQFLNNNYCILTVSLTFSGGHQNGSEQLQAALVSVDRQLLKEEKT